MEEELFETDEIAQRLCEKRKLSKVEGASDAEEPLWKRRRIGTFIL
jgi:hypothetical protein